MILHTKENEEGSGVSKRTANFATHLSDPRTGIIITKPLHCSLKQGWFDLGMVIRIVLVIHRYSIGVI